MLRERLLELLEPLVARLGYELVDIEYAATRSEATLRVYIDWPDGKVPEEALAEAGEGERALDGIGIDDCEKVSRELSALLDVEDPIPVAYQLEVSSPGTDRVLRTARHYQRFLGERVHMELAAPRDGRRRYTGTLVAADEDGIELNVDGVKVSARLAQIGQTRLAPEWSKPGPKGRKR
ncbi:MAG: ribosome maturation factor RimP [Steroidobacteraceae bacterium]